MTYVLRFLPEVEEDAVAAYAWYEKKSLRALWVAPPVEEVASHRRVPIIGPLSNAALRSRCMQEASDAL
jgi:hypothetical protein